MRIATGGISHETSTLAKTPTTVRSFETGMGIYHGQAILDKFRGTNICTGGFLEGAASHQIELVPLLWACAYPSGLIPRDDYAALKNEFLDGLRRADAQARIDGVLLDLHGAMVAEGADDADGDFIASVRDVVGPSRPIVVTFDLHGNHTRRRVAAADAIVGFDTYPHVDMIERGLEAVDLIVRTIRGEARPVMAIRQIPLFWSASRQVTAHPPIDEAFRLVHSIETRPGILSVTLSTGFPWADVPEMGPSVIVVADGDADLARRTADELGDWIWDRRATWFERPRTTAEGLAEGERIGRYPIILADQADNTGGGAPGDSTEVLQTFLDRKLQDALVLYMVDPDVARQAHAAGIGAKLKTRLGGKSDPIQGAPVNFEGEVLAISNGRFKYDGPMFAGLEGDLGLSAWLRSGGVNVVVTSVTMQPLDQAFARSLGIDCSTMRYLSAKSAVHFRSGFEQLGGTILNVNAPAIHTHDFSQLPYAKARPMYPYQSVLKP